MGKKWLRLGAVALATIAVTLLSPASPASAATCKSGTCYGKDPTAAGCGGDARTLENFSIFGSDYYELRYSPICNAAWARVSNGDYVDFEAKEDGRLDFHNYDPNNAYTYISPMISFTYSVRVCGVEVYYSGYSQRYCTAYR